MRQSDSTATDIPSRIDRAQELHAIKSLVVADISAAHEARELALGVCRQAIRACSRSIRMVHRQEFAEATAMADDAERTIRQAQDVLRDQPKVRHAGFLHDAEKEYAEARIFAAFVELQPIPSAEVLCIENAAWLNGLAEAASELRRYLLDQLRLDNFARCDALLEDMDDVYELLVSIDFPDAITGGLRRTTDAYRAVLERTRSDYTTAVLQAQLRAAIDAHHASMSPRSDD